MKLDINKVSHLVVASIFTITSLSPGFANQYDPGKLTREELQEIAGQAFAEASKVKTIEEAISVVVEPEMATPEIIARALQKGDRVDNVHQKGDITIVDVEEGDDLGFMTMEQLAEISAENLAEENASDVFGELSNANSQVEVQRKMKNTYIDDVYEPNLKRAKKAAEMIGNDIDTAKGYYSSAVEAVDKEVEEVTEAYDHISSDVINLLDRTKIRYYHLHVLRDIYVQHRDVMKMSGSIAEGLNDSVYAGIGVSLPSWLARDIGEFTGTATAGSVVAGLSYGGYKFLQKHAGTGLGHLNPVKISWRVGTKPARFLGNLIYKNSLKAKMGTSIFYNKQRINSENKRLAKAVRKVKKATIKDLKANSKKRAVLLAEIKNIEKQKVEGKWALNKKIDDRVAAKKAELKNLKDQYATIKKKEAVKITLLKNESKAKTRKIHKKIMLVKSGKAKLAPTPKKGGIVYRVGSSAFKNGLRVGALGLQVGLTLVGSYGAGTSLVAFFKSPDDLMDRIIEIDETIAKIEKKLALEMELNEG